jgi:hypothetical protein
LKGKIIYMVSKLVPFLAFIVFSCTHVNKDPNILSKAEFKNIIYLQKPDPKTYKAISTVSVTRSGYKANILNTLPDLYRNAMKKMSNAPEAKIYLSNLEFDSFTRRELVDVRYEDCQNKPTWKNVPYQKCTGYGTTPNCSTDYLHEMVYEKKCEWKYRKEMRDVLYQRATATIYDKNEV